MWEIGLLLGILGAKGGVALWNSYQKYQRRRAWQETAVSCGLQEIGLGGWGWWGFGVSGRQERLRVWIEAGGSDSEIRIVVRFPGPPDLNAVRIRPERLLSFRRARGTASGDEAFDSKFSLEGPQGLICALLDAETRRLLLDLETACRVEISGGSIRAEAPDRKLPHLLPRLFDLGRRLAQSMDAEVPQRLAENAKLDPAAGVRLQNLLLLVRERPEEPPTVEALRTACSDPDLEVRLRAAEALGAEGRSVLLKLAESAGNDTVSAQAVALLDRELPFESVAAILDRALDGRRLRTARACVEVLGLSGDAAAVEPLAKVLAQEKGELAAAAAQALGALGSVDAESRLIQALQYEDTEVRTAAANALARVGSAAAVLPLQEAAERSLLDLELRRATRQAIAEIQSRLQGASPGQLSLAAVEAGQLSLAQAEAGQLSLATDAAGQLSLAPAEPGQLSLSDEEGGREPAPGSE